jgi:hypothetical protein
MKQNDSVAVAETLQILQGMKGLEFTKPEFRTKFNYALTRNKRIISEHLTDLAEVRKSDPNWVDYDAKRIALCDKFATKDEAGKAVMENNKYTGLDNNKEFNTAIEALRTEYKDNLHEGDIDVTFYKIKEAWLPVSANFLGVFVEILFELIEWEEKA